MDTEVGRETGKLEGLLSETQRQRKLNWEIGRLEDWESRRLRNGQGDFETEVVDLRFKEGGTETGKLEG